MTTVRETLLKHNVDRERIREEDFAVAVHKPKVEVNSNWTLIGRGEVSDSPETIHVELQGESIEVAAKPGQNIVETLLEAGHQPPYSCMDGACMACLGKVVEGMVYQTDPGVLTDDNIELGECLTCQAKPLSRIVRITYDNL